MSKKVVGLAICAMLLVLSFPAWAQQTKKVARIGYLSMGSVSSSLPRREAFRDGLRNLGYVEGQSIIIEYGYAESNAERLVNLANDMVRLKLDVIVAGGTQVNLAVKKITDAIPIVMANTDDPLGSGLVESLAKPGKNITGLSSMSLELDGKRLELLREAFPKVRRLGVLWYTASDSGFRETVTASQTLGFDTHSLEVQSLESLDATLSQPKPVLMHFSRFRQRS